MAHQSSPKLGLLSNALTYNDVILCSGFEFPKSFVFVVPVRGLYFLSSTITKRKDNWYGDLFIEKEGNGKRLGTSISAQHTDLGFSMSFSNQVLLELEKGDRLFTDWSMRLFTIRPPNAKEDELFEKAVTFTGFLISPVNQTYNFKNCLCVLTTFVVDN